MCGVCMVVCVHVHMCVLVHIYVCGHKILPFIKSCHSLDSHGHFTSINNVMMVVFLL